MSDVFNGAVLRQAEDIEAALLNFDKLHKQLSLKTDQLCNELKAIKAPRWWGGKTTAYEDMLNKHRYYKTIFCRLYRYGVLSYEEAEDYNIIDGDYSTGIALSHLYTEGQPAYLTPKQNFFVKKYKDHSGVLETFGYNQ